MSRIVCKPVDGISDLAFTSTLSWRLLQALIWIVAPIGFWAALYVFLPSVVLFIAMGLPVAAAVLVAASIYKRKIVARRHFSFRLSQVFGIQV